MDNFSALYILCMYVQMYLSGIKDEHRNVRNSALFAIGQFAEHLQVSNN